MSACSGGAAFSFAAGSGSAFVCRCDCSIRSLQSSTGWCLQIAPGVADTVAGLLSATPSERSWSSSLSLLELATPSEAKGFDTTDAEGFGHPRGGSSQHSIVLPISSRAVIHSAGERPKTFFAEGGS